MHTIRLRGLFTKIVWILKERLCKIIGTGDIYAENTRFYKAGDRFYKSKCKLHLIRDGVVRPAERRAYDRGLCGDHARKLLHHRQAESKNEKQNYTDHLTFL